MFLFVDHDSCTISLGDFEGWINNLQKQFADFMQTYTQTINGKPCFTLLLLLATALLLLLLLLLLFWVFRVGVFPVLLNAFHEYEPKTFIVEMPLPGCVLMYRYELSKNYLLTVYNCIRISTIFCVFRSFIWIVHKVKNTKFANQ